MILDNLHACSGATLYILLKCLLIGPLSLLSTPSLWVLYLDIECSTCDFRRGSGRDVLGNLRYLGWYTKTSLSISKKKVRYVRYWEAETRGSP